MRIKHANLAKIEGELVFLMKSQTKERNTECIYYPYNNTLYIAGKLIEKHPKFKDVVKFENWCNVFFAEGRDEYDNKE